MSVETNENVKNINEKVQDVENVKKYESIEIIGENTNDGNFDMEATQKIVFLDELRKDTEKSILKMIENKEENPGVQNSVSEVSEEPIVQVESISSSEVFEDPIVQVESISNIETSEDPIVQVESISNSEVSEEPVVQVESISNLETFEEPVVQVESISNLETSEDPVEQIESIPNFEASEDPIVQTKSASDFVISEQNVLENPNQSFNESNTENTQTEDTNNIIENNSETFQEESLEKNTMKTREEQHAQDKKDYRLERTLFDRINKMQGKIKESLELIKKFERINAKEENLPNIVTTLHDKLTHEVIKQFRTVGIEFNMKSYLVQSIVSDLLYKFEEGITEFRDCSENLNFVREVQEDFESRVELAPTSKVKNFFARLRGMFKPERQQEKLEQLERERQEKKLEEANIHLIKYKFINSELERYTIKNNIVNSLTREILRGQGSGLSLNVTDFINEKIAPEMKKLGLDNLIPDLEENLYQEYKEKDEGITKEDFSNISIGDLRKNMKLQKMEIIRNKINIVSTANKSENEEERMVV